MQPLLDGAGYGRKNVVRIAAHQSYGADHNHQNHRQHHCIFSDVLTLVFMPQITHDTHHVVAFLFEPGRLSGDLVRGSFEAQCFHRLGGKAAGIKVIASDNALYEQVLSSGYCGIPVRGGRKHGMFLRFRADPLRSH